MRAFRVGQLVDGRGGAPLKQAVLLEENGVIAAVGHQSETVIPPHATVIDAPGSTLMPGMIDTHVHLAYSGSTRKGAFRAEASEMSYPLLALRAARYARESLEWGFTALRDLNAPGGVVIDLARAIDAGHVVGPRVRACGLGITATGGHMDPPGWGDHVQLKDMSLPCNGPDQVRQAVRSQVKRGAHFIKINLCVGSVRDLNHPYRAEMTDEEFTAAIDETHRLERHVAAHTSGGPTVLRAVKVGLDTVEHGHWIDEETADAMAQAGAYYVPTLLVNERNFEIPEEEMGVGPRSWAWLHKSREDKWISLERVRKAGVKIAVGTDAGFMIPHGSMNARELELLMQGGLSALEAITAATLTGAQLMGLDKVGALLPGWQADLVLVAGDPLSQIKLLQQQANLRVFTGGQEHSRATGEHS